MSEWNDLIRQHDRIAFYLMLFDTLCGLSDDFELSVGFRPKSGQFRANILLIIYPAFKFRLNLGQPTFDLFILFVAIGCICCA